MLEAVIAVLGVLLGVWVLVRDDIKIELLALAKVNQVRLMGGFLAAAIVAVLGPFVSATWIDYHSYGIDWSVWAPPIEGFVLVVVMVITLWPLRHSLLPDHKVTWDLDLVEAATKRIQELVRQGKASTAAAVVARISEKLQRPGPDGDGLEAYEKLLDWCLRHDAFVEAMVREQTETVAKMFRVHNQFRAGHGKRVVEAAFVSEPRVLLWEIARCTTRDQKGRAYHIPEDCLLLKALLDDPNIAEHVSAGEAIGEAMRSELKSRTEGDSAIGDENLSPLLDPERHLQAPIAAAIHFYELMLPRAMTQGLLSPMGLRYLVSVIRHVLPLLKIVEVELGITPSTRYYRYLDDILELLRRTILLAASLPEGNANGKPVATLPFGTNNLTRVTVMAYANGVAAVIQGDRVAEGYKGGVVINALGLYSRLVGTQNGVAKLETHATLFTNELAMNIDIERSQSVLVLLDKYTAEDSPQACRRLRDTLEGLWSK